MEYKDYYKILGVDRNSSEQEIKRAYRRLAREFHPDVNPDDKSAEEKFKGINEAYEVLNDSEKRRKYDQLGANWQQWQQMGRDPGQFDWTQWFAGAPGGTRVEWSGDLGDLFGGAGAESFSDFFRSVFGGAGGTRRTRAGEDIFGRTRQRPTRGQDMETAATITLEEAFHGTTRVLKQGQRRIRVKIPPGARTGSRVRIAGKGQSGYGDAPSGDLYLNITVKPHPIFEREGDHLCCDIDVDLYTAVLGGQIRVPALNGDVSLKIPAGTEGGKTFRLRGKGMPNPHNANQYGDLLVTIRVQIPQDLNAKERALFEELSNLRKRH
ncbi:MAG TPA: J domain-containing protein [Chloroflexi bacterium]|nr:J domain-containing protein [Chloroflexota bacterium]